MKKMTAILLAFVMICAIAATISAADPALRLQAARQSDGRIAVTVFADGAYVTSAQLLLRFDDTLLEFVSGEGTTGSADDEADARLKSGAENTVLLNFAALHTAQGALMKVYFRQKDNKGGEADFSLKIKSLFTSSGSTGYKPQPATLPCLGASLSLSGGDTQKETYYRGDVDMDGKVSSADARLTLRAAVKLEKLSEAAGFLADADGDNTITAADARLILRASVGLEKI